MPALPMGIFAIGANSGSGQSVTSATGDSSVFGPEWQQQGQQYGVGEAQRLYSQGGQKYYPGDTVAALTPQQKAAMQGTQNLVMDPATGQYINQGYNAVSGLLDPNSGANATGQQGYQATSNYLTNNNMNDSAGSINNFMYGEQGNAPLNAGLMGTASFLGDRSNSMVNNGLSGAQDIMNGQTNSSIDAGSQGMAGFLGDNYNAYTSDAVQAAIRPMIANFQNNILPKLRLSYGGNVGNTGQGIAEGLAASGLAGQLTDAASKIGYDSWNANNANKMNASQSFMNQGAGLLQNKLGASSLITGQGNNMLNNSLNASNALMGQGQNQLQNSLAATNMALSDQQNKANTGLSAGQQQLAGTALGMSNLNTPLDATTSLYDKLFGVGQVNQTQQQNQMDANKAKWDFNQQSPWQNLMNYMTTINQNYGTNTSEQGMSNTSGNTRGTSVSGGV